MKKRGLSGKDLGRILEIYEVKMSKGHLEEIAEFIEHLYYLRDLPGKKERARKRDIYLTKLFELQDFDYE